MSARPTARTNLSTSPVRRVIYRLVLLGVLGIAAYLTWTHYAAVPVGCPAPVAGVPIDCARVLDSSGGSVAGLPLALWGGLWALAGWVIDRATRWVRLLWAAVGLAGVGWAVGHEAALGALCLWCTAMQAGIVFTSLVQGVPALAGQRGTS
jgi:uncharacterized membrane protein